jgi:uncharacterized protein
MDFEWDDNKRLTVLAKHGVDFRAIALVWLDGVTYAYRSDKTEEERLVGLAQIGGRKWAVVYTIRDNAIRLVTARKWKLRDERKMGELLARTAARTEK